MPNVSFPGFDLAVVKETVSDQIVLPSLSSTGKIALTVAGQPTLALPNNAATVVPGFVFGLLLIEETQVSGHVALVLCGASLGTTLVAQTPSGIYSVTLDTASKLNVYWNGTNIVIQNKIGADRTVRLLPFQIG